MRATADTNVLVRAVVGDDRRQAAAAAKLLLSAELVALSLPCLCELVWVLRTVYHLQHQEIAEAIESLIDAENAVVNRPAAEAGLAVLRAGGDFADGAIAWEGRWLGGETFVSFDKKAVATITALGEAARVLG
jgi:predicted nucleic-acid-binding protein